MIEHSLHLHGLMDPPPSWLGAWMLGAPELVWPAVAALSVGAGLLLWSYRRAGGASGAGFSLGDRWRAAALGLKLLGVALLALCLLEPLASGTRAKPGANLVLMMADNSRSMRIHDRGSGDGAGGAARGDRLRRLLEREGGGWMDALGEQYRLRRYVFDRRARRSADFAELDFRGRASAIGGALRDTAERYRGRPVAGIVLLTDGNATDLTGEDFDAPGMPPVYPVVLGGDGPPADLAVENVSVRQTAFEDAPVTVRSAIRARGFAGREIRVELLDGNGEPVRERTLSVGEADQRLAARFEWRPEEPGLHFCRVRVRAADGAWPGDMVTTSDAVGGLDGMRVGEHRAGGSSADDAADETAPPEEDAAKPGGGDEATLANNSRMVMIRREAEPYRVLYVGGRPSWEYKFLRRAMAADDQVQLVGLIRMARREPKFQFKGRSGERSNPLFRGFDEEDQQEAERYDQPVLIRLNTEDEKELAGGFPSTAEGLFGYHAVVIDDLEAGFFEPEQIKLLRRYVSDRGAGLLMLGGDGSFAGGGYADTPVGRMLPVYLDRVQEPRGNRGPHRLNLTRAGLLEPWARLRETEVAERDRLEAMPGFRVVNPVGAVKPGANVIATVGGRTGGQPAIAVQRFGRGRTAAVTIGDLWRWGFREPDQHEDLNRAWRQMLRHLVVGTPDRVELSVKRRTGETDAGPDAGTEDAFLLRVRARDERFKPIEDASASIEVTEPGGETVELRARRVSGEPGVLEVPYVPRRSGGYRVRAEVADGSGEPAGSAEAGFTVDFDAAEFGSLKPNRALLGAIAERTGGRVLEPAELAEFAGMLPEREAPITEPWIRPLWHTPALFLLALGCFVAEWILRRRRGLP